MLYSLLVAICALYVTTVIAFANSGALLIRNKAIEGAYKPKHIERARDVKQALVDLKVGENDDEYVDVYQLRSNDWDSSLLNEEHQTINIPAVVYRNIEELDGFSKTFSGKSVKILSKDEIRNLLNSKDLSFIVQVIPTFDAPSIKDKIEEKIINLYNNEDTIIVAAKREDTQEVTDDNDDENDSAADTVKLEQEIENDFAMAEKLAAEEDKLNDNPVTILGEDVPGENSTTTKPNNLFTNYQFFTSGIWSGIIVSGFLLAILYTAISWIASLEITYSSFEKQVDFDKKNE